MNIHVGPGNDINRSFKIGASDSASYTGTVNLIAGLLAYHSNVPLRIGVEAGAGIVNVGNGQMRVTGASTVQMGTNDAINFTTGGTGGIAILNWDSVSIPGYTLFKALVDGEKSESTA